MPRQKRKPKIIAVLIISLLSLAGCSTQIREESAYGIAMDTVFQANLQVEEDADLSYDRAEECVTKAMDLEIDFLSRFALQSELYAINASAGSEEGYPLSPEMQELLELCLELSQKTEGAFDISIGTLCKLWDIDAYVDREINYPGPPLVYEVQEALGNCGYEKIRIQDGRIYLPEGMLLDLGGIGKGYYLEEVLPYLPENQVVRGLITAGGSVLTYGQKEYGRAWGVGILSPYETGENRGRISGTLDLKGTNYISTSGGYERFVDYENVRYHHILDPRTGYPVGISVNTEQGKYRESKEDLDILSVTVVMSGDTENGGVLTDALSTAVYVMGEEEGVPLAESYGAKVLLLRRDGSIYCSKGLNYTPESRNTW